MVNKVYQNTGTPVTWRGSGGSAVITLASLAAGAGRQGAFYDFGAVARPYRFMYRAFLKVAATPTVANVIDIYWKTSDGTNPDNSTGVGDAAVGAEDKLRNLRWIGRITIDEASTSPTFVCSGEMTHRERYGAPVFWNRQASAALSSTASDHGFDLIPIMDEIQ